MTDLLDIEAIPFLATYLWESRNVHAIAASTDGMVRGCNPAMADALKATPDELSGRPIRELLRESDAALLQRRIDEPRNDRTEKFLLNFVDANHSPFTLECRCEVRGSGFLLLGEPPDERHLQEEWLHMNNQLAVLGRENARKSKELEAANARLEQALRDLEGSYWHLKKIQEVLPICMECGKVKSGGEWASVVKYLQENALFLSHGYCPECLAGVMAKWGIEDREKPR